MKSGFLGKIGPQQFVLYIIQGDLFSPDVIDGLIKKASFVQWGIDRIVLHNSFDYGQIVPVDPKGLIGFGIIFRYFNPFGQIKKLAVRVLYPNLTVILRI